VIFVYRPATILFVFIIVIRAFSTTEASKIVRVIIVGESQRLSVLVSA
jgi:hypothetical protein